MFFSDERKRNGNSVFISIRIVTVNYFLVLQERLLCRAPHELFQMPAGYFMLIPWDFHAGTVTT